MAEKRGRDISLLWGGTAIDNLQSWSFSGSTGKIDTTSFDSSDWETFVAGTKTGIISFTANVDYADSENFDEAAADWIASTSQAWLISSTVSSDTTISGTGIIMSLEYSGDLDSITSYSGTIENSGAIAQGTVS